MLLIWVLSSAGLKIQWPDSASLICVIGIITILKNGYFWRQVWYRQRITPWRDIWHEIGFLYPHFLEKGRTEVYHTGGYMEGVSREQAHLSRQETEKDREKKNTSLREEPSLWIRVEYTAEGTRGFRWCTWMSRGHTQERSRRTCGRNYPYHPGAPGRLSRMLTACLWCR